MTGLNRFWQYCRIGRLLHLIALLDLLLIGIAFYSLSRIGFDPSVGVFWVWSVVIVVFTFQALCAELDSYSRYQNYKQLKDQLYFNGFQERILKPMVKSRCQRDAALVACRELGLENDVKAFYLKQGYKWYHVPPDFVFTHPSFFFSKHFWRTTFFVPYYAPKVDFTEVDLGEFIARHQQLTLAKAY